MKRKPLLILIALFVLSALGQALKPDNPKPAVSEKLAAEKSLSEVQSLKLQILLYKEQLTKLNAQMQTCVAEGNTLREQLASKASESVRTEESTFATQVCKESGIADADCGKWMNAQLQKALEPAKK